MNDWVTGNDRHPCCRHTESEQFSIIVFIQLNVIPTCWSCERSNCSCRSFHWLNRCSMCLCVYERRRLYVCSSNRWSWSTDWERWMQGVNWQTFCFHTFFFLCFIVRFFLSQTVSMLFDALLFICRTSLGDLNHPLWNCRSKNQEENEDDRVKILTSPSVDLSVWEKRQRQRKA